MALEKHCPFKQQLRKIFCPWPSAHNVLLALAMIFFLSLVKLTASEWASWVQAFGSIFAIAGALSVSRKQVQAQNNVAAAQIQHQMNMVVQAAKDKAEAFFAVVDYAATSCDAICNMARQKMPVEVMRMTWEAHLKEISQANLLALRSVPVHELGSYELVVGYSTVLASYINFISEVERTINGDRRYHAPESNDLYAGMIQQSALVQAGFGAFKDAHALKFGGLPEGTE